MKLFATEITPFTNSSFDVQYREGKFFSSPFHTQPSFHSHPELELVYIIEGYGKRVIGNKVESFDSGDMVFIGSNVPHIWLSDQTFYKEDSILQSKAIVAYLNPKIFSDIFNNIIELRAIKSMIEKASRGIKIFGHTRDLISNKLMSCTQKVGYEKFEEMMQIMHLISISEKTCFIDNENISSAEHSITDDRLIKVMKFIRQNFSNPITLKEIARIACLTEQSFCRYFKNKTKRSFSEYLLKERMKHAAYLLIKTDQPISDIAFLCGYNSSSRFCQIFKDKFGQSPLKYKSSFQENVILPD